jgi:hypothetical protein
MVSFLLVRRTISVTNHDKRLGISLILSLIVLLIIALMLIIMSGRFAEPPSVLIRLRRPILEATGSTLLAGLAVVAMVVFWNLLNNFSLGTRIHTTLSRHIRVASFVLVLLTILLPIMLSLFKGMLLSYDELRIYAEELFLSVVVAVSASVTFRFLARQTFGFRGLLLLGQRADQAALVEARGEIALHQAQAALDQALVALEQGGISHEQAKEIEQTSSLSKWILQRDDTGWYELREEAFFGEGLTTAVRAVVDRELQQLSQEKLGANDWACWNGEYEKRLRLLLSPRSV